MSPLKIYGKLMSMTLFVGVILLASCNRIENAYYRFVASPSDAVVSIGDHHLHRSDIENLVPEGTSPADSAAIVETYIRSWATDILMYRNAKRNVQNEAEIRRLLDDYERTITIHYYRQNMVRENVKEPTDAEAAEYWQTHQSEFILPEPAVKGLIVALPHNTKNISTLRRNMQMPEKNIADIERFAHRNAIVYSLFTDDWQLLSAIEKSTGKEMKVSDAGYSEYTDSATVNMIYITEYAPAQSVTPLPMALDAARSRLFQQRKMQYLRNIDNEIYQYALGRGEIVFNLDTAATQSDSTKVEPAAADSVVVDADTALHR